MRPEKVLELSNLVRARQLHGWVGHAWEPDGPSLCGLPAGRRSWGKDRGLCKTCEAVIRRREVELLWPVTGWAGEAALLRDVRAERELRPPATVDVVKMLRAMTHLPDELEQTVRMRYGIRARPPMTLEAVGAELGISKEAVRQRVAKAARILRRPDLGLLDGREADPL